MVDDSFEVEHPSTCERCKTTMTLWLSRSLGFAYMTESAFKCPSCGAIIRQLLPGSLRSISL